MLLEVLLSLGVLQLLMYTVYRFAYAPYQVWKRHGIKGPTPVPLFGNYRQEANMKTLKYYDYLHREYGSVTGFYIGQQAHILVTDLDMLKQIMVTHFSKFMDRKYSGRKIVEREQQGLLGQQGELWKRSRHILSPSFSIAKLKMMIPLLHRSADTLVEIFEKKAATGECFDLTKLYSAFTMETILASAFGYQVDIQRGEADQLTKAAKYVFEQLKEGQFSRDAVVVVTSNFSWLLPLFRLFYNMSKFGGTNTLINRIALGLVRARRNSGKMYKDMLQLMINAADEEYNDISEVSGDDKYGHSCPFHKKMGKLNDKYIGGHAQALLLAGYETTANALAFATYLLALNPDIQEKLQSEIDSYFNEKPEASSYEASQEIAYLDNIVQETLRLYPSIPRFDRLCLETTTVKGITIPQGSVVVVPVSLIHSDPRYWSDPETFNPDRFTPEERAKRPQLAHMPFGFGPRSCIARRFALLEVKIAIMELLKKYKFVRTPDTEVPLKTVFGAALTPKGGIYLKVVSRKKI